LAIFRPPAAIMQATAARSAQIVAP
jgi:hypothetical protein